MVTVWVLMRLDDACEIRVVVRMRLEMKFAGANVVDPMHPFIEAARRFARDLKDRRVVIEGAKIAMELLKTKVGVGQQVRLVQHERANFVKEQGILGGFIVAFGDAQDADLGRLAKIELRRTRDIADVFNEQQIDPVQVQFAKTPLHKRRFQMACAAGEELDHRHGEFFNALGITCCRNIAFEHGDAVAVFEKWDRALQQRRFTGAWRADEIDRGDMSVRKLPADP